MKTYKHLYEQMLERETIENAFYDYRRGRSKKIFVKDFNENFDLRVTETIEMIQQGYPYVEHRIKQIYDGISRKKRNIIVPSDDEQILHHVIMQVLKPILGKPMYHHSYASIPGKGCKRGKNAVTKWIKNDVKGTQYYLQMDIRKYFENISHELLKGKLSKIIKDDKFMEFIDPTISVSMKGGVITDKGLPLGFYTSQWYSNYYLTEFDHWVVEVAKAKHYVRYMDDLVIFGATRNELINIKDLIKEWLWENLSLELKPTWRIVKLGNKDGEDLDFMGYRFYRNRVTVRKKILFSTSYKARMLHKKPRPNEREARQMLSKLGRLKGTNTYNICQQEIIPYISTKQLRQIISYADIRANKYEENNRRKHNVV